MTVDYLLSTDQEAEDPEQPFSVALWVLQNFFTKW